MYINSLDYVNTITLGNVNPISKGFPEHLQK